MVGARGGKLDQNSEMGLQVVVTVLTSFPNYNLFYCSRLYLQKSAYLNFQNPLEYIDG